MIPVLVLHGPNLNLLGEREPGVYGAMSLIEIDKKLTDFGDKLDFEVKSYQSNSEGALIDKLQEARHWAQGVVLTQEVTATHQ